MKCLIIGGSGGIGRQLSVLLEKKFQWDVTPLSSKDLDVTSFHSVDKFFDDHNFDIVVHLATKNHNAFCHKIEKETLKDQIDVNVFGATTVAASCLKMMRRNSFGRLIFASSILSEKPEVGTSVYSASKSYVETLCRVASIENASKNITVNSIQLGYIDAGMLYEIPSNMLERIKSDIPMGRWGSVDEVSNIVKLLSDNEYITGTIIKMAGGL